MKLETFKQAIKGQKTIRLTHKMARGGGYVIVSRTVEVSDLSVGESGSIQYTCYLAGVCRHVLTRVSDVIKVESLCTIEDWNAGCAAFDALHDLVGLRGM